MNKLHFKQLCLIDYDSRPSPLERGWGEALIERNKSQLISLKKTSLLIFFIVVIYSTSFAQQPTHFTSFKTGQDWLANDSLPIDCHGGNSIYIDSLKTFFWYGEHYGKPRSAACYSSKDLYNWKNGGVVREKGDIEIFERPKVVYDNINKRYVMWFHYDGNRYSIAELGVAVSDKPTGPFRLQIISAQTGMSQETSECAFKR